MKLPRNIDRMLALVMVFILTFVMSFSMSYDSQKNTYAGNEEGRYVEADEYFVTFYDEGEKLTVKTGAKTVGEAISRAGIVLAGTDIVEPGLEALIDAENFFINIYRSHPAVVKDGQKEIYVMTASYDPKTVAREAGLTVYDGDEVKISSNTNFLETGVANKYEIIRNGGRRVTEEVEISFDEVTVKDYELEPGVREVRQLGEVGIKQMVYEVQYKDNVEMKRELISENVVREPVERIVAVGASLIERTPLTAAQGRNYYTVTLSDGTVIERQETFYDLNMSGVMRLQAGTCGVEPYYTVREDGVKVDPDGYVLVAANLGRYPRCSVVETSLGLGKVYDTGGFAAVNPEQFDIATDWSNRDGV